jgi:5'-deoxynucleotidase YfbR-like HD superfamily hydrolase
MSERKPEHSIFTSTGTRFWPLQARAEEVNIVDIAHALSMQCRFTGHTSQFYSVAQHCVHVSELVPPEDALWGLLHDATEAYLIDLARPVKYQMPEYRAIEKRLEETIAKTFKLTLPIPKSVKDADNVMLNTERRDLMNNAQFFQVHLEGASMREKPIRPWSPYVAKEWFLERYRELTIPLPRQFASCGIDGMCGWEQDLTARSTVAIAEDFANRKEI